MTSFKEFFKNSKLPTKEDLKSMDRRDAAELIDMLEAEIEKERLSKKPKTTGVAKGGYIKKYSRGGGVREVKT